jgi:hypothetical protein
MRRKLTTLVVFALLACALAAPAGAVDIQIVIVNNSTEPWKPAVFQDPPGLAAKQDSAGLACTMHHLPGLTLVCGPAAALAQVQVECGYYDFQLHRGAPASECLGGTPLGKVAQSDVPDNMLSLLAAIHP